MPSGESKIILEVKNLIFEYIFLNDMPINKLLQINFEINKKNE